MGPQVSANVADKWRWLLLTHIKAASGSPRMDDCTNSFKAARIPGCVSIAGLPPPPCRRTRMLDITAPERRSARPRSIVLRARPVARDTATTPPRPAARASLAANNRRPFSSSDSARASNRALMAEISITRSG